MGHVCGQWECSLGAIISLPLFPSLISNKNRMKRTWLREKKCIQGNKQGLLLSMDGRQEETLEVKSRLSVVLGFACFPCVRDAHEATRKPICADLNVSIRVSDLPHALASSLSLRWGHIRHTATRNLWASFPQGLPPIQGFLGKHLMLQHH